MQSEAATPVADDDPGRVLEALKLELAQAIRRELATAEVLKVISRSPANVQPVLEIIGERAENLCEADISVVSMVDGDLINLASIHGVRKEGVDALRRVFPM